MRSRVVELSEAVVDWLRGESMTFPDWLSAVTASSSEFLGDEDPEDQEILDELDEMRRQYRSIRPEIQLAGDEKQAETSEDEDDGDEDDEADEEPLSPELEAELRALSRTLEQHIRELGGDRVFAKLNWRAPVDASWVTVDNTLASRTPAEVFLLLKSSDRMVEDLTDPGERFRVQLDADGNPTPLPGPVAPEPGFRAHLVLRKWTQLSATSEFRCFVRDNRLVGISQRSSIRCPVLGQNTEAALAQQRHARDLIAGFWDTEVAVKFPLQSYSMDVYLDRKDRVWIVGRCPQAARYVDV